MMYSIPMAITIKPIIRDIEFKPDAPSLEKIKYEERKIKYVTNPTVGIVRKIAKLSMNPA